MRSGGTGARAVGRVVQAGFCLLALLLLAPQAWAFNTYSVTTGGDDSGLVPCTGSGTSFSCNTLRDAITTANGAGGGNTIIFASSVTSVTLNSNLNTINTSANTALQINGGTSSAGSVTINGAGNSVFYVATGSATFANLTVSGATATGGAGASSGGGGGLGAGGGLFVANGATVSTNDVFFSNDSAVGGAGANGVASTAGGNGGGLNGGSGGGGAGGTGAFGGGGGGSNGGSGGAGGFGGGGGGGATGGAGGFAGGSGGSSTSNGGGGGGGALGGAIMVASGGTLDLDGADSISGSSATAGAGGTGGTAGLGLSLAGGAGGPNGGSGTAAGAGIFLAGSGTLGLDVGSKLTETISDPIADQTGSGGTGANAGSWGINVNGAGTVVLGGANAYTGGTTVTRGTLSISADNNLGAATSSVTLSPGTTLAVTGTFTFDHAVTISGDPTFDVSPGATMTVSSVIADGSSPGSVVKADAGTLVLTAVNTYTGSTTVTGGTLALSGVGSIATSSGLDLAASGTVFDISGSTVSPTLLALTGVSGSTLSLGGNTLIINQAGNTSFAGTIADGGLSGGAGGSILKEGAGTLTLGGFNTYTGATTISGGTLALGGNGSIAESSGVALTASGTTFDISGVNGAAFINGLSGVSGSTVNLGANELVLEQTGSATFAGTVTGNSASNLVFDGSGSETLSGVSTATGSIQNNGSGTLSIAAGGSIASFTSVQLGSSNATLDISHAGNQTVQNLSGDFGGSVILGANTLTDLTNAGNTFAGVISGTGGLTVAGTGSLILDGTNTYSGATTITGGTLAIDFGGSIANSSGVNLTAAGATFELLNDDTTTTIKDLSGVSGSTVAVEGFSTLAFGTANSTTFAGTFAGDGELLKQGSGVLTLTGDSSGFDGTTIVSAGGIDIAPTTISGGSLGGSVTVENGAFVEGHGTIGGSLNNVGGIVASLGAAVPLTVGGSYTQNSAATLVVGVSPTAATRLSVTGSASLAGTLNIQAVPGNTGYVPFTRYLILNANGGVTGTFSELTGALPILPVGIDYGSTFVDLVLGGFRGATSNENAVANSLNTAFSGSTGDFAQVLDLAVNLPTAQEERALSSFGGQIYGNLATVSLEDRRLFLGAMDERLRLLDPDSPSAAELGSLGEGGLSMAWGAGPNALQMAALSDAINDPVGLAVEGMATDATSAAPLPVPPPSPAQLYPQASAPSPPPYAPSSAPPTGNIIEDPVGIAAQDVPVAPPARNWGPSTGNLWARGFGQFGSIANGGGALGADYTTGGGAIGTELIHTRDSLLGLAVGGGQSNVSLNTNPETGTISFVQLGAYGATAIGDGLVVDGAAIYSHDFYDVTRGIFLPGTNRVATSSHGGNDGVLDIGLSHPYIAGGWEVTPRAGFSYYHIGQSSFSESGANSLDLNVNPNDLNALFSRIGIAFAQPFTWGEAHLVPEFRAAWLHNFLDLNDTYNAAFSGSNAPSFVQSGVPIGREAADVGLGLGVAFPQTAFPGELSGFLQYDATLATHATINSIAAGVRYKW
jgi:fibronectin-binding autotransporter adhesin